MVRRFIYVSNPKFIVQRCASYLFWQTAPYGVEEDGRDSCQALLELLHEGGPIPLGGHDHLRVIIQQGMGERDLQAAPCQGGILGRLRLRRGLGK